MLLLLSCPMLQLRNHDQAQKHFFISTRLNKAASRVARYHERSGVDITMKSLIKDLDI